jgi:hypothetical protein
MITRWFVAAGASLAVAALGCGQPAHGAPTPRDRDLLTHEEIVSAAREGSDLYEALQSLRPHFLEPPLGVQPGSAPRGTTVYIDSRRAGGLETLKNLIADNVDEVRYLGPTQSQNEYGPRATLVTLVVKLRHPSRPDTALDVTLSGRPGR